LLLSNPIIQPDFFGRADEMRSEFAARVRPDRTATPQRFAWDYWYVEGQYAYMRSLARHFFSPNLYRAYLALLRGWGEKHLGCSALSELWISYYIDGCHQNLHTDVGQGAWAVVFSLTGWDKRRFTGGETVLLNPVALDYWRHFDPDRPLEHAQLFHHSPSRFNELIVFDARVPHAVTPVEGTRDPMDSRVVLHGWFYSPDLFVDGCLTRAEVKPVVDHLCSGWNKRRSGLGHMHGVLTLRLWVSREGGVERAEPLATTLVSLEGRAGADEKAIALGVEVSGLALFPCSAGSTTIVVPLNAADR
jgi:hypothetical protein